MVEFFHMSPCLLSVGDVVRGSGRDKVDPRIEAALEAARPVAALSRIDAVFCLEHPDFSRCGIVNPGYIYRVRHEGLAERYDLSWISPMQKALLKIKHGSDNPGRLAHYPDWTDDLMAKCCTGYWSRKANGDPDWEHLAPALTITSIVTSEMVDPGRTSDSLTGEFLSRSRSDSRN